MTTLKVITCEHEGTVLRGELAAPSTAGRRPTVLVMHNAHGLGEQVRRSARRLAELGYVAIATDMYGDGAYHRDREAAGAALGPLWENPRLLRARVAAWYDCVKARPEVDPAQIAAIGYCFGGQCVLELARSGADVKAVVSYHGILTTASPAQPGKVKAAVVVYTGAEDPYAPRAHVDAFQDEMRAAGAHWQITSFGGCYHAFTDPDVEPIPSEGLAYNAMADRLSWVGTVALLEAAC